MVAEEGKLKGLELELEDRAEWIVGRDPELSSVVVEDPSVSRQHLVLEKSNEGIVLRNLSSTSLTLVNGQAVLQPLVIKNGDLITMGDETFRFHNEEESHPQEQDHYQEEAFELKPTEGSMNPQSSPVMSTEDTHDSIFEDKEETKKGGSLTEIHFDLAETGRFLLKVISGPNNGAEFAIQPGKTYLIGTDPNTCDIVFHDTSVSRQHARLTISDENVIEVEDLKSRNGTLIDNKPINAKSVLPTNVVVTIGTTSFIVYDREGNMQTIISPLLPQIVKALQKEDQKHEEDHKPAPQPVTEVVMPPVKHKEKPLGAFILMSIITGLFVISAIGLTALFKSEPVEKVQDVNAMSDLKTALDPFSTVKYSFNKSTGRLLLVGHVLNQSDKTQLMYNLQGLKFVKNIDDSGVVIDDLVSQAINPVIDKNPKWRGITVQTPSPGQFVLTGYLPTRKEAENLYDYITTNFPYLDRLERQVVVQEDVVAQANQILQSQGIRSINVQFGNGEVVLTGGVPSGKQQAFSGIMDQIKKIPGVRQVRSQVSNLVTEASTINISDRYEVSGYSKQGANINVVVNGRIISKGDSLDGMQVKGITNNSILLEKDNVSYRIDFNK